MNAPRRDATSVLLRLLPLLVVVAAVVVFFVWRWAGREPPTPPVSPPSADRSVPASDVPDPSAAPGAAGDSEPERRWRAVTGEPPVWPQDFASGGSCEDAVREIRNLCRRLDRAPDVQKLDLPGGTFGLLQGISDDLGARSPPVEGVWRSLDRVRANVSHVLRVLGRSRTAQAARIARAHPEFAEPMALALYRWMRAGDSCAGDEPRPMGFDRQYDHAAFLINTIGGQAYLRRRAPEQEALASFYALLIAERAIEERRDRHGVNVLPEIDRCIELMRGRDLVFRDRYLEILTAMRRKFGGEPRG